MFLQYVYLLDPTNRMTHRHSLIRDMFLKIAIATMHASKLHFFLYAACWVLMNLTSKHLEREVKLF